MRQTEIERKFLVAGDGWRGKGKAERFRQGYIARTQNRTVRVRVAGGRGILNIKLRGNGITRNEFEYEIPLEEACELLKSLDPREVIEKTRHTFNELGKIWEVDEFEGANSGLIIAEIELDSEDELFDKPAWLGKEVSHVSRYFNAELSRQPYSAWSDEDKRRGT
ncbi:MAG: CYTH domain-containing protein [Mailhella sp.]|nr:CYTH domain-containing protein [Mailhella sp.]